jgi:phosphatidylserine/phosphatidylglycerophosphate/cardiolipin synthase-like enzyme
MNFDNRSLVLNDESNLMVLDRTVGQQMNAIFLDDLRHSAEITRVRFGQRSWVERLTERAAQLITRSL